MAQFLSPAWFEDVARHTPAGAGEPAVLTLEQVVTGGPSGEVRYQVVVGDGSARIARPGASAPHPDVTVTTDWDTASAVASGRLSTQAALGGGRLRIGGDLGRLAAHQGELAAADPVPAPVRAATTWADAGPPADGAQPGTAPAAGRPGAQPAAGGAGPAGTVGA